jgi:putative transposase
MKQHRQIPEHYVLKSVTVSKAPSGKYYASILFEYEQIVIPAKVEKTLGLDFSMAELYVGSEGNEANYPRYYRRSLAKLQKMSRTLSKMKKFSNNWYKQKHKITLLHEKIANQRKDFLHQKSREIANSCDLVGVEDLNMQTMSKSLNFGKSVADNAFGMFRMLLKYKLEEQGKYFVTIDKWFPSSKKCSTPNCNYIYKDLTMDIREWVCPECGVVHNRDHNAAINIRNEAVRIFSA